MKSNKMSKIALERIYRLFELAEHNEKRAKRYIEIARGIGKKHNVKIPEELKGKYCKKCNSFLDKSNSVRAELGTMVEITCKECGAKRKLGKAN